MAGGGARAAVGCAREAEAGEVYLARPTHHECHGRVHVDATQRPVVTPVPRRACPTWVRHVRRGADVVARDIAAERAPTFQGDFNLLNRFSNTIFSKF
jgi:hypothetical protein